uniref:HDC15592 n=1 Tax=Drosophila melanogaster TaxID=7227 RepID=Q6IJ97_DROME|nr:TPA_inf: HDC15592 [Drosophila melanogaster]
MCALRVNINRNEVDGQSCIILSALCIYTNGTRQSESGSIACPSQQSNKWAAPSMRVTLNAMDGWMDGGCGGGDGNGDGG